MISFPKVRLYSPENTTTFPSKIKNAASLPAEALSLDPAMLLHMLPSKLSHCASETGNEGFTSTQSVGGSINLAYTKFQRLDSRIMGIGRKAGDGSYELELGPFLRPKDSTTFTNLNKKKEFSPQKYRSPHIDYSCIQIQISTNKGSTLKGFFSGRNTKDRVPPLVIRTIRITLYVSLP